MGAGKLDTPTDVELDIARIYEFRARLYSEHWSELRSFIVTVVIASLEKRLIK